MLCRVLMSLNLFSIALTENQPIFCGGNKIRKERSIWLLRIPYAIQKMRGLGFRDLKAFNLAPLAKQGWRLLSNPQFLLARVPKDKYFPHCNFIQAKLGVTRSRVGEVSYGAPSPFTRFEMAGK